MIVHAIQDGSCDVEISAEAIVSKYVKRGLEETRCKGYAGAGVCGGYIKLKTESRRGYDSSCGFLFKGSD